MYVKLSLASITATNMAIQGENVLGNCVGKLTNRNVLIDYSMWQFDQCHMTFYHLKCVTTQSVLQRGKPLKNLQIQRDCVVTCR